MSWRGQNCERCFEWAACWDGICQPCQGELKSGDVAYASPAVVLRQCEVCGKDTDHTLCSRCEDDFVREMEQQHERWSA